MTPDQHKEAGGLLEKLRKLDYDLEWINASDSGALKVTIAACLGGCSGPFDVYLSGWRHLGTRNEIAQKIASLAFQDIAAMRGAIAAQLLALGVEPPSPPENRRSVRVDAGPVEPWSTV